MKPSRNHAGRRRALSFWRRIHGTSGNVECGVEEKGIVSRTLGSHALEARQDNCPTIDHLRSYIYIYVYYPAGSLHEQLIDARTGW